MNNYKKISLLELKYSHEVLIDVILHIAKRRKLEIQISRWIEELKAGDMTNLNEIRDRRTCLMAEWEKFEPSEDFQEKYFDLVESIESQDEDLVDLIEELDGLIPSMQYA